MTNGVFNLIFTDPRTLGPSPVKNNTQSGFETKIGSEINKNFDGPFLIISEIKS